MKNYNVKFKIICFVIPANAGIQGLTVYDFQLDPGSSPGWQMKKSWKIKNNKNYTNRDINIRKIKDWKKFEIDIIDNTAKAKPIEQIGNCAGENKDQKYSLAGRFCFEKYWN